VSITDLDELYLFQLGFGDLILGLSQFWLQPELHLKIIFASRVVKSDLKNHIDH